jgi:hypothetical protein
MATGDAQDILGRIKALLPRRWFPDSTPVLDALLSGPAWALALVYSLIQYAKDQTRIGTATDGFLDLISYDYFGTALPRRHSELDAPFRARILATLLRPKATRPGMIASLVNLTGRTPIIFEPWRVADTGAWGGTVGGFAWNTAGAWGSLRLNAQAFITAYRPGSSGIPNVAGWNSTYAGWGAPYLSLCSLSQIQGAVTDADIYATVDSVKAAGTTMWTRLSD